MHKFILETRGEVSVLKCSQCKLPFADIQNGKVRFISRHGSHEHENFLTIEHLKMMAVEMYRQQHPPLPPERW